MRKSNTQKLSEALKDFIRDSNLEGKLDEIHLIKSWEDIVGKTMARYTKDIYIKDSILFVIMSSSVARHQLLMLKEGLKKALNEKAGKEMIQKIVIK